MSTASDNTVAYCGLKCDECFVYTKTISEAVKSLRREMRAARLKEAWKDIPFLGEYDPFKKTLDSLAGFRCNKVCRDGGGNPWCKIRKCCQQKEVDGCWECAGLEGCDKLAERYLANVRRIKRSGIEKFVLAKGK